MRKSLLTLIALLAAAPLLAALPKGWVGRETCATCHEDTVKAFLARSHGRAMQAAADRTLVDRSCETCHGPGEAHANDPTTKNIKTLKGVSTAEASSACGTCHAAQKAGLAFRTHGHEKAGVACLDCHVWGHTDPVAEPMLARTRAALCSGCHASQTAQFALPYAHRNGKTPFDCTSCHTVHGGTTVNGRVVEDGQPMCVACHTEKAGPQVYPHPPMAVNGCIACHSPHGSPNAFLLNRASTTQLCLECHTNTPTFHDLSQPKFRACVSCHAAVHGSQRDPKLFQE